MHIHKLKIGTYRFPICVHICGVVRAIVHRLQGSKIKLTHKNKSLLFSKPISLFKGMEKSEAKEGRELPKGDVLFSPSLLNLHETKDAKHGSSNCGKSQ